MYKTEKEIFTQHFSLKKTYDYLMSKRSEIEKLSRDLKGITWIGSGSSYFISRSAELSTRRLNIVSYSIPAGDLMMNFPAYNNVIKDTLLISLTRSGKTSEVLECIDKTKKLHGNKCVCLCMTENSPAARSSDVALEMPWAFDESVCQTRTVTNLYLASLMFVAMLGADDNFLDEIKSAVDTNEQFINDNKNALHEVSKLDWNKAVVLADAQLEGISMEGALAFKEICQISSNYYHVLDSRHGPMVLFDKKTLVVVFKSSYDAAYQNGLISDIKSKGSYVVCVTAKEDEANNSDLSIRLPEYNFVETAGISFICALQNLAFFKAIENGINPDEPNGLDPWINI